MAMSKYIRKIMGNLKIRTEGGEGLPLDPKDHTHSEMTSPSDLGR